MQRWSCIIEFLPACLQLLLLRQWDDGFLYGSKPRLRFEGLYATYNFTFGFYIELNSYLRKSVK